MSPYLITITFLMMMTILTSSHLMHFADKSLMRNMSSERQTNASIIEEFVTTNQIAQFQLKNSDTEEDEITRGDG